MHARKTMIQGSPEQVEQARQVIESHVIPKAKEMRGFRGGYWLTNRRRHPVLHILRHEGRPRGQRGGRGSAA